MTIPAPTNPGTAKTLNIYRGDTFVKQYSFTRPTAYDEDGYPIAFAPVNLAVYGNQWNAQLRPSEDSAEDIIFNVDTSQLSAGIITLRLEASQTVNLPQKGDWDLQVVDNTQNIPYVRTLIKGQFIRTKDVTRL